MKLLSEHELEASAVVANSLMNRDRGVVGTNSYTKELRFDPMEFLDHRLRTRGTAAWLDLCCGSGKALIEAAERFAEVEHGRRLSLVGVDLIGMFNPVPVGAMHPQLLAGSVHRFEPQHSFDLVTCVHGLHYVGDKLQLIAKAVSWLKDDGRFAANVDFASVRDASGKSLATLITKQLRDVGMKYDLRTKVLSADGRGTVPLPFRFLGADDTAGPNYTGAAAVSSYYAPIEKLTT
jgi:SAM-dependent methyltransferase